MKIRQLLSLACGYLNKPDAQDFLERGECTDVTAAEEEAKGLLVAYGNAMETASAREKLIAEYTANAPAELPVSDLPDKPTGIISVMDKSGKAVQFNVIGGKIHIKGSGEVTVRYTFVPCVRTLDDECDYPPESKLTPRVQAYLICAEYLSLKGCYSLAEEWYKKFEKGSAVCLNTLKGGCVKRRLWW